jgi:hypothetical protein
MILHPWMKYGPMVFEIPGDFPLIDSQAIFLLRMWGKVPGKKLIFSH